MKQTLPIRLMVGLWFLVPAIGVRVPDRQQRQATNVNTFVAFAIASPIRDSKGCFGAPLGRNNRGRASEIIL